MHDSFLNLFGIEAWDNFKGLKVRFPWFKVVESHARVKHLGQSTLFNFFWLRTSIIFIEYFNWRKNSQAKPKQTNSFYVLCLLWCITLYPPRFDVNRSTSLLSVSYLIIFTFCASFPAELKVLFMLTILKKLFLQKTDWKWRHRELSTKKTLILIIH